MDEYEQFVKDNYSRTRSKMKKLLMDDIPEEFVTRQLNDSRYISKVVKSLLSNIVREKRRGRSNFKECNSLYRRSYGSFEERLGNK